jgi:hypothetical protein
MSREQHSHIATFINTVGLLLMSPTSVKVKNVQSYTSVNMVINTMGILTKIRGTNEGQNGQVLTWQCIPQSLCMVSPTLLLKFCHLYAAFLSRGLQLFKEFWCYQCVACWNSTCWAPCTQETICLSTLPRNISRGNAILSKAWKKLKVIL